MTSSSSPLRSSPTPDREAAIPARRHRAWIVAAVTLAALVAAAAFRSSTGVLMEPIENEFGWSRATTSGAVSLNLVLYGCIAPFAAAVMERWGVRRTVTLALLVVAAASAATTVMTSPWQLWLLWGLLIGVGTGCMALVLGAIVANRWFYAHRGLVTGLFSGANATGQLLFLPAIAAAVAGPGWRYAAMIVAVLALVVALLVGLFLRDYPHKVGLMPFGVGEGQAIDAAPSVRDAEIGPDGVDGVDTEPRPQANPGVVALSTLRRASGTWTFWALALTFFVCGWSTNGIVQTHFVPAAHDHGMAQTTAAGLLAMVGVFDLIGTIASGWLTDRVDSRYLLVAYYALRGASLLTVEHLLAPHVEPPMWGFIVFYGLDWVATVPPTVALCRQHFGLEDSGIVFGWCFASHMIGAGIGASFAGWVRTTQGSYDHAWLFAAALCFAAAVGALLIPRRGRYSEEQTPVAAAAG